MSPSDKEQQGTSRLVQTLRTLTSLFTWELSPRRGGDDGGNGSRSLRIQVQGVELSDDGDYTS